MKRVFIINPKSGKEKKIPRLIASIERAIVKSGMNAQIYLTKAPGDAARFVKEYCETNGPARFIACGGDGTFSEVVNGAIEVMGTEVGVFPLGTGNDFCRNFPKETEFHNILLQLTADAVRCDAIRYVTQVNGEEKIGYCANMVNIGFDCNVADKTAEIKQKTIFGGSMAYLVSIFLMLIQKKGAVLTVTADGKEIHNGKLLLHSIANGGYCGGGILSNPMASLTDGNINFNVVKNISRLRFLSLLPSYMKGTHMNRKGIEQIITAAHCRTIAVTPHGGTMRLCIDGEIITAEKTEFTVIPGAFSFVLPVKSEINQQVICQL